MDFKKFLEMMNEAESTAEKDDKAEKAAKKVAKDIEYDEGHKGKDDDKAEKAGEKVKKDIEYDDKKDKKSLKDWFEIIDKNMLAEAEQLTIEPAKQNTQVIKQGTKTIGTVSNPALAATIKSAIGKGEMSLAGKDMKEDAEDNPESAMLEKWAGDAEVKPTGQYKDKTKEELKSMLAKLHKSGPHDKDSPAAKKMRQINFALRAKGGWKKGEGAAMKEAEMDESALQAFLGKKKYGEEGMKALQKAGREGASKEKMAQIRAKHDKLDELSPNTLSSAAAKARGQGTAFLARSGADPYRGPEGMKPGWNDPKSVRDFARGTKRYAQADKFEKGAGLQPGQAGSHMYDLSTGKYSDRGPEGIDEKAKNPYAIGMAQAMKSTGDKPPLKKSTITKAHDIAKSIKKKTDEAEIPSSGPDYGAGLGAGRSQSTFEGRAKADNKAEKAGKKVTKDLEYDMKHTGKDDNKAEKAGKKVTKDIEYDEKKAAADKKKKKVDEAMNTLEAAYHEGKSHGLTKHGYACRYDEGSDEHRRYHEGFKEGLDECYGLMPNRGLVVSEVDSVPATVPGMADQAMEAEIDEMNKTQYMQHKAKTTPGDTFKAFGQTFKDKEVLETDTFAFESLDKQLEALINEDVSVNEGLSVSMSTGQQGSPDSVSVTGTDDEAAKLLAFIKQVGLGGIGADAVNTPAEPAVAVASDYGAPKFSGHDDMVGLMKLTTDDYKDEESHDHDHGEVCNECGMSEAKCGCDEGKEMVDEVETPDQLEYEVAEDDGEGNIEADEQGAQIDAALAVGSENEKSVTEDGMESSPEAAGAVAAADAADEEEEAMSESEQLDEWANDAGKDGTQQAFTRDIEFMTKVISGGLNKPKSTGQTTIPVIAGQEAREGDEDVKAWKKLAGLAK